MTPPTRLREDLELDSLDAVDMVVVLERTFGLRIRQEEALGTLRTLEDLHRFVIGKVRAREDAGG
jgi:acyl carrier protein